MTGHRATIRLARAADNPARMWFGICKCGMSWLARNPHNLIAAASEHVGVSRQFDPIVAPLKQGEPA